MSENAGADIDDLQFMKSIQEESKGWTAPATKADVSLVYGALSNVCDCLNAQDLIVMKFAAHSHTEEDFEQFRKNILKAQEAVIFGVKALAQSIHQE